jgi:hypothetical protein
MYRAVMSDDGDDDKLDAQMPFRLTSEDRDALVAAARANKMKVQTLLRFAVQALVRCQQEHGEIPPRMEIVQRDWPPRTAHIDPTLNERAALLPHRVAQKKSAPTQGRIPGAAASLSDTAPRTGEHGSAAASA